MHYAGVGCDLAGFVDVLAVAATRRPCRGQRPRALRHATGGASSVRFGRFATLSFHETKNFICGEGGALLVNGRATSTGRT